MAKSKIKKKKAKVTHVTYNQKAFLAPNSINSMAAIHCKIDDKGIVKVTISDCNNSIRIWNDFNTKEGKVEIIEKLDMLTDQIHHFKAELLNRCSKEALFLLEAQQPEFEKTL